MKKSTNVFLSRLSPLHRGHQLIIDQMMASTEEEPLALVGSSNNLQDRTPFTYHQRKRILGVLYPDLEVLPLPDVGKTEAVFDRTAPRWLEKLQDLELARNTNFVFHGGSAEDLKFLSEAFTTKEVPRHQTPISATLVRKILKNNDFLSLRDMVDDRVIDLVCQFYQFQSAQILSKDPNALRPYHWICSQYSDDSYPPRSKVLHDFIPWEVGCPNYQPTEFSSPILELATWAHDQNPHLVDFQPSYEGDYLIDKKDGRPLNPLGRTSISGRGLLGKWGANQAVDSVILRKQGGDTEVLQIKRPDGTWAFPGGFIDDQESCIMAATRELAEECNLSLDMSDSQKVYQGYIDDPRNTDNAWIESTALLKTIDYHKSLSVQAGDDAQDYRWISLSSIPNIKDLFLPHKGILNNVIHNHKTPC